MRYLGTRHQAATRLAATHCPNLEVTSGEPLQRGEIVSMIHERVANREARLPA